MTYKQYFEELRKEIVLALGAHHKAEDELAKEGETGSFIDKKYFDKVAETYSNWQQLTNKYNSLMSFMIKNNMDWNAEILPINRQKE